MAKINEKTLKFEASSSPDVVGYRLYYEVAPTAVAYDSPFIALAATTEEGTTTVAVKLNEVSEFATFDNVYNIGVSSVDDAGNESDMSLLNDVPLDLAAPAAPGPLQLI
jgi:hypothetical protein